MKFKSSLHHLESYFYLEWHLYIIPSWKTETAALPGLNQKTQTKTKETQQLVQEKSHWGGWGRNSSQTRLQQPLAPLYSKVQWQQRPKSAIIGDETYLWYWPWFQYKSDKVRHGGTAKQESKQFRRWLPRNAARELTNNKDLPLIKKQRNRTSFCPLVNWHYNDPSSHGSAVMGTALFLQMWKPLMQASPTTNCYCIIVWLGYHMFSSSYGHFWRLDYELWWEQLILRLYLQKLESLNKGEDATAGSFLGSYQHSKMGILLAIFLTVLAAIVAISFYYEHPKGDIPHGISERHKFYALHFIMNFGFGLVSKT